MARSAPTLSDFQHRSAGGGRAASVRARSLRSGRQALLERQQGARQGQVAALATRVDQLQDLFYADRRQSCWWCCRAPDTAGKDGTIRGVFGQTSALGVHAVGWKAHARRERAHDYLWRIHQKVPAEGEIVIFNRSHYEDVLVPTVNGWITPEQTRQRYEQINAFERLLAENGTVICKFLLHISKDEQRVRLQERLDDPTKHWKFAAGDLECASSGTPTSRPTKRHRRHRHALGALDHRAGRFQDPPQPDDRPRDRADARRPEAALPAGSPELAAIRVE